MMKIPVTRPFIDTNVLLYLLSPHQGKADLAEQILGAGGMISVQVLNEFTNIARRKLSMSWAEISDLLALVRSFCETRPLTLETHERGLIVAERYGLSLYDSMIVAAALVAGCETLYSEDMQHGLLVDKQLRLCNPFL
jgi:predicted nucleic acid-binding protein